ncbi:MAG: ATP-dependent DNA helicase RecG [Pseudomonadota bacterium]
MSQRPSILNPLFADAKTLDGVGPRIATLLKKLLSLKDGADARVIDLTWHLPNGVIDRSAQPQIADAVPGQLATMKLQIVKHQRPRGRAPYRVTCSDETGFIDLIFFRGDPQFLSRSLPVGEWRYISGRVESFNEKKQLPHPDHIFTPEEFNQIPLLEPVYPLTAGLSNKVLRKIIVNALKQMPTLAEWQNESWLTKNHFPTFNEALDKLHRPEKEIDIATTSPARLRLAYDEVLANQLALALVRANLKKTKGREIIATEKIATVIRDALPFSLTNSQETALQEIKADMAAPHRMLRLLQGDVGSGKTIVALLVMAAALETGLQTAMMAPTEVLARQHMETLLPLTDPAGIKVELLTGREKGRPRKDILGRVESGDTDILIGTHAIFQHDVIFRNLGLAIIDEQHRFGVHQRLALQSKGGGAGTDMLVMTATPIPRTLLLTNYGDMDVSRLTEKPAGRKPVTTRALPADRIEDVFLGIKRALATGTQAYWVCPLVETSQKIDLAAAEERFAHLQQYFGDKVGLVHGQMKAQDKDAIMAAFSAGDLSILVSTTVIEVGVNVPNASIMVIEHAERFGLAQLHQLRGRVGRGQAQSSCILLYQAPLSATATSRLNIMRETEDGFVIAEEDLRLRGGGEVLGARQSGMPEFRLANLPNFSDFLKVASDDAKLIWHSDPYLQTERGQALRTLMYLFDCDEAVKLFLAG